MGCNWGHGFLYQLGDAVFIVLFFLFLQVTGSHSVMFYLLVLIVCARALALEVDVCKYSKGASDH